MSSQMVAYLTNEALVLTLLISLPTLIVAAGVGLLVGLFQALTQIQDQTLPMAIKVIAVLLLLVFLGPAMSAPLVHHAERVFADFPAMSRGATDLGEP
jgi:type III secretion protein S